MNTSDFISWVSNDEIVLINNYVGLGGDINQHDINGNNLLHYSIIYNKYNVVKLLLNNEANTNAIDINGCTPLILACQHGYIRIVKLLLPISSYYESEHYLPLHMAAYSGENRVIDHLHREGYSINEKDQMNFSPLHWAAQENHLSTVNLLISFGADTNSINEHGMTPMYIAAGEGHIKIVKALVINIDLHFYDSNTIESPLIIACCFNRFEVVKCLVESGFDVNFLDKNKRTAIFYSQLYRCKKITDYLLSSGSCISFIDRFGYCLNDLRSSKVCKRIIEIDS